MINTVFLRLCMIPRKCGLFLIILMMTLPALAAESASIPNRGTDGETPKLVERDDERDGDIPYPRPLAYPEIFWRDDAFGNPETAVTAVTVTDCFLSYSLRCRDEYRQARQIKFYLPTPFVPTRTPTFYFSQSEARTLKDGDEELTVELRNDYWLASYAMKVSYVKNGTSRVAWVSPILADTLQRVNRKLQDKYERKRPAFSRRGEMLAIEWRADYPRVEMINEFPEDSPPWDWLAPLLPKIVFLNHFKGHFDAQFRAAERFMRHVLADDTTRDGTLVLSPANKDTLHHGQYKINFAFAPSNQLPPFIRWSLREILGEAFAERNIGYASVFSNTPHWSRDSYGYLATRDSIFLRLQEGEAAKLRQAAADGIVRVQEFPRGCFIRFADTVFWYDPRLNPDGENRLFRVERRRFTGGTDELFPTYGPWLRHEVNAAAVANEATWTSEIARRADRYAVVVAESCQEANAQGGDLAIVGAAILARVAAGASRAAATGAAFVAAQSKAAGTNGTPEAAATAKAMREVARMALKIAMAAQSHAQARMAATR